MDQEAPKRMEFTREQTYWQLLQDHGKSEEMIKDTKRSIKETVKDAIGRIDARTHEGLFPFFVEERVMSLEERLKLAAYRQTAREMGYEIELSTRNHSSGTINGKIRKIEKKL